MVAGMKVQTDAVVSIDYVLRDDQGTVLDQSGEAPLAYLHGHRNIVPGLEAELEGLEEGASTRATIAPTDGYGERDDAQMVTMSRSQLPEGLEPQNGMMLPAQTEDGTMVPLWIHAFDDSTVTLDPNHPLAGRTLDFEVTVRGIRQATQDELAHGHVHGEGGHAP